MNKPNINRFWNKIKKTKTCWIWTGSGYKQNKYGRLMYNKKKWLAHRFSWFIHYGIVPKNMQVLHRCDNPCCVNPKHLFLGTQKDNMLDMTTKGRHVGFKKLTNKIIKKIRKTYIPYKITLRFLADKYHTSYSNIHHIIKNETWNEI